MRCIAKLLGRVAFAVIVGLCFVGCRGGDAGDSDGDFGLYVPSATPVVRVSTAPETSRASIALKSDVLYRLGPSEAGTPNQYRITIDRHGNVFGLDVMNGLIRGVAANGEAIIFAAVGSDTLRLKPAPLALSTDGENLLLANVYPGRLRLVDRTGEVVEDNELGASPWGLAGLSDDTYIALEMETAVLGRYSREGQEIERYTMFEFPEEKLGGAERLWPQQDFAVGPHRVYLTTAESHQVSAFDIDGGNAAWVLEGDAERIPIPEHISGKTLGRSRRAGRAAGGTIDTEYSQVKWPEFYPALARIATDAQDRLYVFPYVTEENPDRFPVDVYDAAGTLVMHGWLPFQGWDAFAGDAVYRIESRDDAVVVVRYELDIQPASPAASAGQ